ncbi:hypothetical protein ACQP1G_09380 [Nocardia sp. CA-107356]|uniref:hypothetical protein n=1 Tax=Nocardia sp. CA-107356 TaxID=3239972 RepID=UPI003D8A3750
MWDLGAATLRVTLTGHRDDVRAVACTTIDCRPVAITGSTDRAVRVWDLDTGTLRATLTGHTATVSAVACTTLDGHSVAVTGSRWDHEVWVWDLDTATAIDRLDCPSRVAALAIGPNTEIIAAVSSDILVLVRCR